MPPQLPWVGGFPSEASGHPWPLGRWRSRVCLQLQPAALLSAPRWVGMGRYGWGAGSTLKACGWAWLRTAGKRAGSGPGLFLVTSVASCFSGWRGTDVAGVGAEKLLPQIPTSFLLESLKTAFSPSSKEPLFPLSYEPGYGLCVAAECLVCSFC